MCDREGADLFVSSYYTTPIATPSVFLAYDMIPEALGCDLAQPQWRAKHEGIAHASGFIAISEHTARDLVRYFPHIPRDLIYAWPNGVSDVFRPAPPEESSASAAATRSIGRTSSPSAIGPEWTDTRMRSSSSRRLPGCRTESGSPSSVPGASQSLEEELRDLAVGNCPVSVLRLTDQELRSAYSSAIALVYPSKYEGFGLPVLEAMACGCPVITCRNSSLPEVAGDAALYVRESDEAEMTEALQRIQQPEVRLSRIALGQAQAQQVFLPEDRRSSTNDHSGRLPRQFGGSHAAARVASWVSYRRRQSRRQEVGHKAGFHGARRALDDARPLPPRQIATARFAARSRTDATPTIL